MVDRALHPHLDAFAAYVECLAETYERLKQERGAVDFEDLQLLARDVLRTDPAARAAYRFRRLYVDEAQDVNPLQDDLIELLAAGAERVLRVGDEQQSIYRFRWADVDCFRKARDRTHGVPAARELPQPGGGARAAERVVRRRSWVASSRCGWRSTRSRRPSPAVELVIVEDPAEKTTAATTRRPKRRPWCGACTTRRSLAGATS